MGGGMGGFMGGHNTWNSNDSHYMHHGGGWERDYACTLYINWTCNTHATLRNGPKADGSPTRPGYGCDVKLGVFACGTAVAQYFEVEDWETDEDGRRHYKGKHWEHHVKEYVDNVQFSLVTATAGPGWGEGQLLSLPDGSPAVWSLPG